MSERDERPAVVFHRVTPESVAEFLAWQTEGCSFEEFTFTADPDLAARCAHVHSDAVVRAELTDPLRPPRARPLDE